MKARATVLKNAPRSRRNARCSRRTRYVLDETRPVFKGRASFLKRYTTFLEEIRDANLDVGLVALGLDDHHGFFFVEPDS